MIGYTFIEREFWGRRYNAELKSLMLNHAFQFVDRVLFEVGRDNIRSQRALQKLRARLVKPVEFEGLDGLMKRGVIFAIERSQSFGI
jgi:RimJ/RimL family protein N-acetyltransferase